MHEVLVNRLGGLSLPRKSVVRLTDRPDMTLDVNRGRKTTMQQLLTVKYQGDLYSGLPCPQQAHDVNMTSYGRRCDVITSHRRQDDVIYMLCAYWVLTPTEDNQKRR